MAAGDWQCPREVCINHTRMVFASKANCPKCGCPRDENGYQQEYPEFEPPKPEKGMQGGDMPDDWQCCNVSCINHTKMVFGKRSSCPSCGTARNALQPGDWQCPNKSCVNHKNTVFASKTSCPKCGIPRPGHRGPGYAPPQQWDYDDYQFHHRGPPRSAPSWEPARHDYKAPAALPAAVRALPPSVQGALAAALPPHLQNLLGVGPGPEPWDVYKDRDGPSSAPGDWRCPNPACVNSRKMVFGRNATCPKCGAGKPMPPARGPGHGGGSNPGDWNCPNLECVNHKNKVFAKHSTCPQCGAEKVPRSRSRSPRLGVPRWAGPYG